MNLITKMISVLFLASLALAFNNLSEKTTSQHMELIKESRISPEAYFLEAFSDHQLETLKMLELAVEKAKHPELKILAKKMLDEQRKDLSLTDKWGQKYSSGIQAQEEPPTMNDLEKLKLSGADQFDKQFTIIMAQHHKDEVKLAKNIGPLVENKKIRDFSDKSVSKRSTEIGYLDELAERM